MYIDKSNVELHSNLIVKFEPKKLQEKIGLLPMFHHGLDNLSNKKLPKRFFLEIKKMSKVCSTRDRDDIHVIECINSNCPFKYFNLIYMKPKLEKNPSTYIVLILMSM